MVKALLNAPPCKEKNGFADLFTAAHYNSLAYPKGSNRELACDAGELMAVARSFADAYWQLDAVLKDKFVSELEVRLVMHVLKIEVVTRKKFASLKAIAQEMWSEMKAKDSRLPVWTFLRDTDEPAMDPLPPPRDLKELREDGKIPDSELQESKFILGALVTDQTGVYYEIVCLEHELNVSLEKTPKANAVNNTEEKDNQGTVSYTHLTLPTKA